MATPTEGEFEAIVRNLMSPDNAARNQAETMYAGIKGSNPGWLVQALLHVLQTSQDHALRQMCAVILRRAIAKLGPESAFPTLATDVQALTKSSLLQLVAAEQQSPVRRSLTFCVSGLASVLCEKGEWPELFPFLFTGVKDGDAGLKKACLGIFSSLTGYLEDTFIQQYIPVLRDAYQFALGEQNPMEVRVAAVDALCSLVALLEDDDHIKPFQPLVGDMLAAIGQSLSAHDETKATEMIESLVSVAEDTPDLFAPHLAAVYAAMLQIVPCETLEEGVRHIAVELCLTLAECAPRHTRKIPPFIEAFLPLALKFLTTVHVEKDWGTSTEDDDDGEITFYDIALDALDRVALALGGRILEPVLTGLLAQYLSSAAWESRYAGLMGLSQCAEGCAKQFENKLDAIVATVLKLFGDTHERVRWAAVHCIAQLSNDFAPGLQIQHHATVMPALMRMLHDPVPRIVAHTANALVNFLDEADGKTMTPYFDELVTKLLMVLQSSRLKFVNEEVLAAFASVAENSEQDFVKYYDHIVPFLKQLLAQAPADKQDRMLRAKAMECVTLIGMSVGKERFAADAKQVMEYLHATLAAKLESDDPQAQYVLQAWARIAKCLGEEFVPYLPHVIPFIVGQASIQTDVTITDAGDDGDDGEDEEEEGVETLRLAIKGVGDKKIQIKTSLIQEKALACSVLESLFEDVPQGMAACVEQVSPIMVTLLTFPYNSEIRESAAKCLALMLKALPPHAPKADLLRHFVVHLLEAIKTETDVDVACEVVEAFHRCIGVCDANSLPDDLVAKCADILKKVFDESLRRRKLVTKQQKEVHDDDEEVEKLEAENEGEEMLLDQVTEAVGVMVKKCRAFIPSFATTFYPLCMDLLGPQYGDVERRLAICAFDDFVEHGSQISAAAVEPFMPQILAALLQGSVTSDAPLLQASVYARLIFIDTYCV